MGCAWRPNRPGQLDRDEDFVDAVLCAYVALYRYHGPEDVAVFGDFATGNIMTRRLPAQRAPACPTWLKLVRTVGANFGERAIQDQRLATGQPEQIGKPN